MLDVVETQVSETTLEEDGYYAFVAEDDICSEDEITKISTKLLTTGEATALVVRCWERRRTARMEAVVHRGLPEDLGITGERKAISNVTKKADLAIEIWEGRIGKLDSEYGETLFSKVKLRCCT